MHIETIQHLRCPRSHGGLQIDRLRSSGDEIIEAFLVGERERRVYPVVAGVAALPVVLRDSFQSQGSVWWRTPAHDPRMVRFLRRGAGHGYIKVAFEDIVRHYRDLAAEAPEGYHTDRDPEDLALEGAVRAALATPPRFSVVVGCGVGRSCFDVAALGGRVLGLDTNLACVRRVRNIAVTVEDFFLPGDAALGVKTILLDLASLVRDTTDVALAHPLALPVKSGAADLVVLRDVVFSDFGLGEASPEEQRAALVGVREECRRILAPGGTLLDGMQGAARPTSPSDWDVTRL